MAYKTFHQQYRLFRTITAAETALAAGTMDILPEATRLHRIDTPRANVIEIIGLMDGSENQALSGDLWAARKGEGPLFKVCDLTFTQGTMQVIENAGRLWNNLISGDSASYYYFDTIAVANDVWTGTVTAGADQGNNRCAKVIIDTYGHDTFYFRPASLAGSKAVLLYAAL